MKILNGLVSAKLLSKYDAFLDKYCALYSINTKERLNHFLAQLLHESGKFIYVKELASGEAYDTGKLAVMLGNTPEDDDDGRKYKGRGLIQITGRSNYSKYGKLMGIDLLNNPDLLEQPEYAVWSACLYWNDKNLNKIADKPDTWTTIFKGKTYNKIQYITLIINGGQNGLADRQANLEALNKKS